jgi:hypothetical protein
LQSPKLDNRRRETPHWIRLVLFALALIALFIFDYLVYGYLWLWFHVSVAVPPPLARTASELQAIAAGLAGAAWLQG